MLCTSEPQSMAAAARPLLLTFRRMFRLLRLIDPSSIPESPLNSPSYQSQDGPWRRAAATTTAAHPAAGSSGLCAPGSSHEPRSMAAYPWATEIVLPDHSFGASGGRGDSAIKLKYNIAPAPRRATPSGGSFARDRDEEDHVQRSIHLPASHLHELEAIAPLECTVALAGWC